jgi:hypothetical protein
MRYLGWILFLLAILGFLLIYNIIYLPLVEDYRRLKKENELWQKELIELKTQLITQPDSQIKLSRNFFLDELFVSDSSFSLSTAGEVILKESLSSLLSTEGKVHINGYLTPQVSQEWLFGKIMTVVKYLNLWGISNKRLTISILSKDTASTQKPYLEIVVK